MILNTQEPGAFSKLLAVCSGAGRHPNTPIYKTGAYLSSALSRIELAKLHKVSDTAGTGIRSMGHSTSPRTMQPVRPEQIISYVFVFQSYTTGP